MPGMATQSCLEQSQNMPVITAQLLGKPLLLVSRHALHFMHVCSWSVYTTHTPHEAPAVMASSSWLGWLSVTKSTLTNQPRWSGVARMIHRLELVSSVMCSLATQDNPVAAGTQPSSRKGESMKGSGFHLWTSRVRNEAFGRSTAVRSRADCTKTMFVGGRV